MVIIMIRLATVFSGIGAIEHALDRMKINHEIVFACDNGDIDILTKTIGVNIDEIGVELEKLDSIINEITFNDSVEDLYKEQLQSMLIEAEREYSDTIQQLNNSATYSDCLETSVLQTIVQMEGVKKTRVKEYKTFIEELQNGSIQQKKLKVFQVILELTNDYKKDNSLDDFVNNTVFVSSDGINWKVVVNDIYELYERLEKDNGKKIIRRVQDLSQRTGQLHEKINYLKVQKDLTDLGNNWKARKAYVDKLYQGLERRNKVKQSYMANYSLSEENFHWNVAFLDGRQYEGQVDLFVGGSPCQSFSFVGKQRGLDDTRGTLFYEYARLIDEIKPRVFIYENVRAVLSNDGGRTWKKMQQVFSELDYDFYWKVLNARDYGIPQNRERLFVIGFRKDLTIRCPMLRRVLLSGKVTR